MSFFTKIRSYLTAMTHPRQPLSIINSVAPIRICDNGGWTDTWFARHGKIFNIGVYPYAEVQIAVYEDGEALGEVFRGSGQPDKRGSRIVIHAENYGERYVVIPERHWDKHPLLEAAIEYTRVPRTLSFEVTIFSEAPGGASTGTSAAVTVALIGALDRLSRAYDTPRSGLRRPEDRDRAAGTTVRHPGPTLLGLRGH